MARSRDAGASRDAVEGTRGLRRSRHVSITWRGVVALSVGILALVLAYVIGRTEYLVAAVFALLLPLGGLLYVRLRRPKLEVVRLFSPPVVSVGGTAQVTVRITNLGVRATTPIAWEDALPWEEEGTSRTAGPITPGRRHTRVATYDLHPPRRGLYAVGPFVVEHEDPFGFATATLALGAPDRLVVVPAVSSLSDGGPSLTDGEGEAQLIQRRVTGNDDDLSTREYRPGDALRRVHWRASARHGELMVRQEEQRSHPDARILVDTRRAGYPDAVADRGFSWGADWASDSFEWVVRMVASLGLHLEQSGFRVQVDETGYQQIDPIEEVREARRAESFLTSLAGVQLIDQAMATLSPFTGADGRGPVFAVLGDPEESVIDWLAKRRAAGDAGYAFLVEPRAWTAERMREAGWTVVEARATDDPAAAWRAAASAAVANGAVHGSR